MLQRGVGALGGTLSALTNHAKQVQRRALEASHEHSKELLFNVVSILSRDEQMRRERSDAAVAMLATKMELVRLQKQLMQPVLMMPNGQMDAAMAEEHMDRGGNITRAHATTRMLEVQDR